MNSAKSPQRIALAALVLIWLCSAGLILQHNPQEPWKAPAEAPPGAVEVSDSLRVDGPDGVREDESNWIWSEEGDPSYLATVLAEAALRHCLELDFCAPGTLPIVSYAGTWSRPEGPYWLVRFEYLLEGMQQYEATVVAYRSEGNGLFLDVDPATFEESRLRAASPVRALPDGRVGELAHCLAQNLRGR